MRITHISQKDKTNFIFKYAFQEFDYQILNYKDNEMVLFFLAKSEKLEEIKQSCEKFLIFCKTFLGDIPFIMCSGEAQRYCDIGSVYEKMVKYTPKENNGILIYPHEYKEYEREEQYDTLFQHIQVYICKHYTEKITLSSISGALYISPGYLSRFYKKNAGENLFDTINSLRIETAKRLLKNENKKIYEVSEKVGFEDTAYFSKVFKKYTGCTPKEYAQTNENEES